MTLEAPSLLDSFAPLASNYDALLCDVWGVVHNGIVATAEATEALERFRQARGTVVLVSNAPRPGAEVMDLLDRLGVPRSTYDRIVTSGDVARAFIAKCPGTAILHIGPERDRPIFSTLDVDLAPIERAGYVLCTGLFDDETEAPEDYRGLLERMRSRDLLLLCANPDLVVERGDRLVYCAGAVAELYHALGGKVIYTGKPHGPIYDQALTAVAEARGAAPARERVLAIGDSVRTDLKGASAAGLDALFITAGIHADELGDRSDPDLGRLALIFAQAGVAPRAVMRRLAW
jgi:HAD superfamily hydrolase (TIGR01459 family)